MNEERYTREHIDKKFNILNAVLRKVNVFCTAFSYGEEKGN